MASNNFKCNHLMPLHFKGLELDIFATVCVVYSRHTLAVCRTIHWVPKSWNLKTSNHRCRMFNHLVPLLVFVELLIR